MSVSCLPPPLPAGAGAAPGPVPAGLEGGIAGIWDRGSHLPPLSARVWLAGSCSHPALGPVVYPQAPPCPSRCVEILWGLCLPCRDFFVISLVFKQSFLLSEKDLALIVREIFKQRGRVGKLTAPPPKTEPPWFFQVGCWVGAFSRPCIE